MNFLAIIPARGKSKGIPHKNVALLGGKPLIAYTCEAARGAKSLSRIVVSTDDEQIAATVKEYGIEAPFMRPAALAKDTTPMMPVIDHVLDALKAQDNYQPDAIVLLQPTSPLRMAKHIDAACALFEQNEANTVVSVVEVPHQFTPASLMSDRNGQLIPLSDTPILRRQEKQKLYARNGPAILIVRTNFLRTHQAFYGPRCFPYHMEARESVDIDTPADLAFAEYLLSQ